MPIRSPNQPPLHTTILHKLEYAVLRAGQGREEVTALGPDMAVILRGLSRVQEEIVVTTLLGLLETGHVPVRAVKEVRVALQGLCESSAWFKAVYNDNFFDLQRKLAPPAKKTAKRVSPRRVAVEAGVVAAR